MRMTTWARILALGAVLGAAASGAGLPGPDAPAAPPKFPTILYGASYYHEYMPVDRLDRDVDLMRRAGLNFARVGESTWGVMEPRDGVFDFEWLQRVLDKLHAARIRVIVGTPTYSIPAWLYARHPEIQVKPASGERYTYGLRQMTDLTHPVYRRYAERIIRRLVGRFKDHPAVIGWQLDNETHPSGTADRHVQAAFREHLKAVFKTPQALNKAWGLNYWGQAIADWSELPPRAGILNPGYKLEWERFQREIAAGFLAWQAGIVRSLKRPDQFITHDFVGGLPTDVDQYAIARALDIPSVNVYAATQDAMDGEFIAYCGDVNRSLKGSNYLVTETTAQTTGWDSSGQFPPYPNQIRLAAYANILSGADLVAYWHWHSLHYGQETYWKGVLAHDLEPGRAYREIARVSRELQKLGPQLVGLKKKNRVAILWSADSNDALKFMPFDKTVDYLTVLNQFYRTLYRLNMETDFIFPDRPDFGAYDLVIVPPLYAAPDDLLRKISEYVKGGGHVLMSFKSGFCNEHSTVRWERAPGPLREAAGLTYQEFTNLKTPIRLKGDTFGAGKDALVSVWAEYIVPEKARALALYDHPVLGRYPAVTRNEFGRGTLTYEGTYPSDLLQEKIVADTLKKAGSTLPDSILPPAVRVKHAVTAAGKTLHAYFNFSGEVQDLIYRYPAGRDLLTGIAAGKDHRLKIAPWDLLIIQEK